MLCSTPYEDRRLRLMAAARVGRTVLDLGYAQLPSPYLRDGHTVGFDLDLPRRPAPGYDEQIQGDVNDIAELLAGRQFDTVLSGELIEHLERPLDHLRNLRELVAPDGLLALSTPNPFGVPVIAYELLRSRRRFFTEDHLFSFPPRWVGRMLDRSGFELRSIVPVGIWLPGAVIPWSPVTLSYQLIYVARPRPRS